MRKADKCQYFCRQPKRTISADFLTSFCFWLFQSWSGAKLDSQAMEAFVKVDVNALNVTAEWAESTGRFRVMWRFLLLWRACFPVIKTQIWTSALMAQMIATQTQAVQTQLVRSYASVKKVSLAMASSVKVRAPFFVSCKWSWAGEFPLACSFNHKVEKNVLAWLIWFPLQKSFLKRAGIIFIVKWGSHFCILFCFLLKHLTSILTRCC